MHIFAISSLILTGLAQANSLSNDPFIREAINRENFEPGGKYHLFNSRGTTSDREGTIAVLPVSSQNVGGLLLEQALINGNISYKTRFSNHRHTQHAPFANSRSRSNSDTKGQALIGFTSYKLNWNGKEVHPADAYDGERGSGYPTPTGARDEYTYNIKGNATRVEVQFDDNRSTLERFKDRFSNAGDMLTNGLSNDWQTATTHNPNLNFWGNKAEIANAVISGVGNITGAGFEIAGASDMAQLTGSLKDIATMEAIRAMPVEAQLTAVAGLTEGANAYDNSMASYETWAVRNPNTAVVAGVAINVTKQTIGKGSAVSKSNSGVNDTFSSKATRRAPEYDGGTISETGFINSAEKWLGDNYTSLPGGRYISNDGMKQVRYGHHETSSSTHHGHFEAYDKPANQGGKVIENTAVKIVPDGKNKK